MADENAPPPAAAGDDSWHKLEVIVRPMPKVIFFYPLWIVSLICLFLADQSAIAGQLWMSVFALNLLVFLKINVVDRFLRENRTLNKKLLLNNTIKQLKNVGEHGEIHAILEGYLQKKSGLGFSDLNQGNDSSSSLKIRASDSEDCPFCPARLIKFFQIAPYT